MKPINMHFIQCPKCLTHENLKLKVGKCLKLDDIYGSEKLIDTLDEKIKNQIKTIFTEDCKISGDFYQYNSEEDVSNVFFGNEIVEGSIDCDNCSIKYSIDEGILDFINTKDKNL